MQYYIFMRDMLLKETDRPTHLNASHDLMPLTDAAFDDADMRFRF